MSSEDLQQLLDLEATMEQMREMTIASLGDGFDETSLLKLDRKCNRWFLEKEQGDVTLKPTYNDIHHYEKSIPVRKKVLKIASTHQVVINRLSNKDHCNEDAYEGLYHDIKRYPYAWIGLIFGKGEEIMMYACTALRALQGLAYLKYENRDLEEFKGVLETYGRVVQAFEHTVSIGEEEENYDDVGENKHHLYELNAFTAQWMAMFGEDMRLEALQYFHAALVEESMWEYPERYCRKLLEKATGKAMSSDDLADIEVLLEGDSDASHDIVIFVWKCLVASSNGEKGSVPWLSSCQACNKKETSDRSLLICARCSGGLYCSKECQISDWPNHKYDCKKK